MSTRGFMAVPRAAPADRRTSTDYAHPYRPQAVALANQLGLALAGVGVGNRRMSVEGMMRAARRATGLHDFDGDSFRTPLGVLCDSAEEQARLNTVGRLITGHRLASVLASRLRAAELFRRHREICKLEVRAPIVIAGLQRTGTTLLHRLLAADSGIRSLASWESIHPAPLRRRFWQRRDPRIAKAQLAERALRYLAPDFFSVHPVEAEAPEEDVILLDYSFSSTVAEAMLHVPRYARWLETQDQTPAYEYMKRLLQLLQWQRSGERWVLKSPHHLEWLDTLLTVFPDAKIIQTHRDPLRTIPSTCSMIAHSRGVFSDHVDPHEVGRHWSRKIFRLVNRAMHTREQRPSSQFLDVSYYDLVADPVAELERIYRFIDRPLDAEQRIRITAARRHNGPHKYGRHLYRLADFGLRPEELEAQVARYRERFGVRHE